MIVYRSMTQLKMENVKLKIAVFACANEFVGADDHIRPRAEVVFGPYKIVAVGDTIIFNFQFSILNCAALLLR